jgi:protein arginine kinase activator
MKCDVCSNEATVFLTQIINGQMTTVNLCETCSKAKGVTDEMGFGLAEAFLGAGSTTPTPKNDVLTCPSCGFTSAQLKKIGRMGCPRCYETFQEGLDQLLASMHKGTRHVGKIPARAIADSRRNASMEELKHALQSAIAEEHYEEAARIKIEMQALQSSIPSEPESQGA